MLQEKRGDIAFAIPSPARRTEKNWVLDPVPLMQPPQKGKAELKNIAYSYYIIKGIFLLNWGFNKFIFNIVFS